MTTTIFQTTGRWSRTAPPHTDNLTSALAPDIVLVLDDDKTTKFYAHRFVLAYHSGYFRTLFATYSGSEVYLSNVDATIFSILLSFMYTGQLHVNAQNVHNLLTFSNFLYILSITELCEEYLRERQRMESARTASVIKPVPRKNPVTLTAITSCQPIETLKYQPLRLSENHSSSIFKPVRKLSLTPSSSIAQSSSSGKFDNNDGDEFGNNQQTVDSTKTSCSSNIIYDIACCDGPIKFRKVLNQFYRPRKTDEMPGLAQSAGIACYDYRIVGEKSRTRLARGYQIEKSENHDDDDDEETNISGPSLGRAGMASSNEDLRVVRSAIKNDVPYYPCKNCGSKFPSYYFVNKHRKLCHTNESDLSAAKD